MNLPSSRIFLSILLIGLLSSCDQTAKVNGIDVEKRDTAITSQNSFSTLFIDSSFMENYLASQTLPDTAKQFIRNFYNQRNFQFAWFDSSGIAEQAGHFWNLQQNYLAYSNDSTIYNAFLQKWADSALANGNKIIPAAEREKVELELTRQFIIYSARAYMGNNQLNINDMEWYIPRRKVDIQSFLDTLLRDKGKDFAKYEPVNRQYGLLRNQLMRYYDIEKKGAWDQLHSTAKKIQVGDTGEAIIQLKSRLFLTGDLSISDSGHRFNEALELAVKKFQHRYGLKEDGVVGGSTLTEMNRPISYRIRQMLVNMERIRWVPAEPSGDYLLVNIPEYTLHAYRNGQPDFDMNVVVGSASNSTVIFTGKLQHVVFSPYWNIPPGILKKEVLPGIKRNPNYLSSHNMEWNGGNVRQKPGIKNSLGLVKFLFPNSYSIYLHDTPSKSLFNESKRDFSHGCIRLSEPKKLAEWILRDDSTWTTAKITAAMNAGKEKYVTVKKDIPVFIGYFTAWVDRKGELYFRNDVYGHDKKLMDKLFTPADK